MVGVVGTLGYWWLGLSFLDAVCCGFGAIIMLLVLTKVGEPGAIEHPRPDLPTRVHESTAMAEGGTLALTLPPHSVTVVRWPRP